MDEQPLTLNAFFEAIEQRIKDHLPGVETVATWPEIHDRISLPALFLELTEFEPGHDPGDGHVGLICRMEAYVIVGAEVLGHHHQAAQLATQLAVLLRGQYWDLDKVDNAELVQAGPDWTKPELDSCTVWKVEWTQQIYLGSEQWPWPIESRELVWEADVVEG